jgi:hypothetical protein
MENQPFEQQGFQEDVQCEIDVLESRLEAAKNNQKGAKFEVEVEDAENIISKASQDYN